MEYTFSNPPRTKPRLVWHAKDQRWYLAPSHSRTLHSTEFWKMLQFIAVLSFLNKK